jgi:hypothetical protein
MRRGWWLSAGVSEINLKNSALNHATWGGLHSLLHLTHWTSGTWATMGKTWTVQVSGLKVGVRLSSRETMHMREMITTMRMWVVTKASSYKVVLSWTKTIWAMIRSVREMRQSTRRSARQNTRVRTRHNTRIRMRREINELIMIWVSRIIKAPLLDSLATEAKFIQVTSTATKRTNKSFLSQIGGLFPHFSLGVEGWLGIGWVVGFGWFECFFLFMIVWARNEFGSTLFTFILISLKPNTQFACGFGCTLLNSA